ncbi:MAG: hypothetical protein Q6373_021435 [Candidatus Sigynarchaeota archaeon]
MVPDETIDCERERREKLEQEISRQREFVRQQSVSPPLPSTGDARYDQLVREMARMQKCIDDLCRDVRTLKMRNERKWV